MRYLLLMLLLSGCATPTAEHVAGTDGPRPDESPDYVILAASGHCLTNCPAFPRENLVGQGTAQAIVDLLDSYGLSTAVFSYADAFYNHLSNGIAVLPYSEEAPVQFGFLQMLADLQDIRDLWIGDYQDPTGVILLGHSHGVVWTHTLATLRSDVPIDYLIDLDGDSHGFEDEGDKLVTGDQWGPIIQEYTELEGVIWDYPIEEVADRWQVSGLDNPQDIEDVVPGNVAWNLEVHGGSFALRDQEPNHRFDGTDLGIIIGETNEEHDRLDDPGSQSMDWVVARLAEIFEGS